MSLIGVPTSAGAYGLGQERAPGALRAAGLAAALACHGIAFDDTGDLPMEHFRPDPAHRKAQNLQRVVRIAHQVASQVVTAVRNGTVPLVIGGDCTITLGVLAGLLMDENRVSIAYFDGDADLSTPTTTQSGVLDAMGVAHMLDLDGAADELAGLGERRPLIAGSEIALIGFEESELDGEEQTQLTHHNVHRFPAAHVRRSPSGAAMDARTSLGEAGRGCWCTSMSTRSTRSTAHWRISRTSTRA